MISPVIKWSGSKRSQAEKIRSFLPASFSTYFEPFIGGGAMLYAVNPAVAVCGDICAPLIALWKAIQNRPNELFHAYAERWKRLQTEGHTAYYAIRKEFNTRQRPEDLLFLSRTCINGLIRFNAAGEFNSSLHLTRPGIAPEKLGKILMAWSSRIRHVSFMVGDYTAMTPLMRPGDCAYLDPPYFHTRGRYYGTIDYEKFLDWLDCLNGKGIKFMLSFDGSRGEHTYAVDIPKSLYKRKVLIFSGNSSFKKVMNNKTEMVMESLYLNY